MTTEDTATWLKGKCQTVQRDHMSDQLEAAENAVGHYEALLADVLERLEGSSADAARKWEEAYRSAETQCSPRESEADDLRSDMRDICTMLGAESMPSTDEGLSAFARVQIEALRAGKPTNPEPDDDPTRRGLSRSRPQ